MPDEAILQLCKGLIVAEINTIKDLPAELANTIANEYYRFLVLASPHIKRPLREMITLSIIKEELLNDTLQFDAAEPDTKSTPETELAAALAAVEAIAQLIEILRGIDKNKDPIQYRCTVELITDYLKYDMPDAGNKLLLKRYFKRAVKRYKKQVKDQIPNLINYIDV